MGGNTSLFNICKGIGEIEREHNSSKISTDIKDPISGPVDDNINKAGGYLYFSLEQELLYDEILKTPEEVPELSPPAKWQSSDLIGSGSFGRVLFAANMATGELMAVKQIPILGFNYDTAHEKIKEIQEEVDILSQLHHKNIVQYLGTERNKEFL